MSVRSERFISTLKLILTDGTATPYFRDFLARVDSFIQQAAVISTWGGISGTLSDQTDLQNALDLKADAASLEYLPPAFRNEASDPYTLVIGDANKVIRFTAADVDVTIPVAASVAWVSGTELMLRFAGTGTQTLDTTGLTINGTLPALAQHVEIKLRNVGTDEWDYIS
jgi:hypothetical protein